MAEIKIKRLAEPEESVIGAALRHTARTGTRMLTSAFGLPANILNIGQETREEQAQKPSLSTAEHLKKVALAGLAPSAGPLGALAKTTTKNIEEKVVKPLTGEYLKPKTEKEEFADEIASDFAMLAIPGIGGINSVKSGLLTGAKKLGISIGGNTLSWMAKEAGAGPLAQQGVKLGFFIGAGMPGTRKAIIDNQKVLYDTAESLIPESEAISVPKLKQAVAKTAKKAESGLGKEAPSKELLSKKVSKVEDLIHGEDKINVREAWEAKKDLNEVIWDDSTPNKAKPHLIELRDELKDILHDYGKNKNPEFYKYFEPAENIEYGLHAQSKVGRFIQNKLNLNFKGMNLITKGAFLGPTWWFKGMPGIAKIGASAGAVRGGYNLLSLLGKSKFARDAYFNAIKASMAGNALTAARNIKKFDEEANKFSPEKIVIKKLGTD